MQLKQYISCSRLRSLEGGGHLQWLVMLLLVILLPLPAHAAPPIKVTYNGNGSDGGSVPVDGVRYSSGDTVTVLAPGSLACSGHLFSVWNTAADGSGTDHGPGDTFAITASVTLHAQWLPVDPETPNGVIPVSGGTRWALKFSDEFNSASLNTSKWGVDVSTSSRAARPSQGISSWYWRSDHVSLDGAGNLKLDVSKANSTTMYCGSVSSDGLYEPTYGYLEARIQIADTTKSTHTAFWLQGPNMNNSDPADGTGNDGAEVDIFESAWFGDYTKSVVHIDGYDADHKASTKQYTTPGFHSGYHVFGLEWTSTSMKIYYDGVLKTSYTGIWVPHVAEWMWLSCGASFGDVGTFASEPVGLLTSAMVDYVRVWEAVPNVAPVFAVDPIVGQATTEGASYSWTLAGSATDGNNDPLTYAKVGGPAWLSVAADGALSGVPTNGDVGSNSFTVNVNDGSVSVNATLNITVDAALPAAYVAWAAGPFANAFTDIAPGGDPDGDGLASRVEFAFGMDPTSPARNSLAYVANGEVTGTGLPVMRNFAAPAQAPDYRVVFLRRKDHGTAGLVYRVEFSAELEQWSEDFTAPTLLTSPSSAGDHEAVSVPYPASVPAYGGTKNLVPRFSRVGVELN